MFVFFGGVDLVFGFESFGVNLKQIVGQLSGFGSIVIFILQISGFNGGVMLVILFVVDKLEGEINVVKVVVMVVFIVVKGQMKIDFVMLFFFILSGCFFVQNVWVEILDLCLSVDVVVGFVEGSICVDFWVVFKLGFDEVVGVMLVLMMCFGGMLVSLIFIVDVIELVNYLLFCVFECECCKVDLLQGWFVECQWLCCEVFYYYVFDDVCEKVCIEVECKIEEERLVVEVVKQVVDKVVVDKVVVDKLVVLVVGDKVGQKMNFILQLKNLCFDLNMDGFLLEVICGDKLVLFCVN